MTSKVNQDPLENMCSVIRTRGGYDPNQSAGKFRKFTAQSFCADNVARFFPLLGRSFKRFNLGIKI